MTRFSSSLLMATMLICAQAFSSIAPPATRSAPFFVTVIENKKKTEQHHEIERNFAVANSPVAAPSIKKAAPKKKSSGGHGKGGLFSPVVVAAKIALGTTRLNKLRGAAISLHSKVIGNFVETASSDFGNSVLRSLFELADTDKNGTIEEEELATALRLLGFKHLKEKQMKGIFARADKDSNGSLDWEEFRTGAPSTLRTNLIKLAKSNGGELGFLA